ncbi:MAG: MBL fold metallo-hydrolase [Clostridiaceae bacterium]|nr:MBL fold metallo-hydrolase [Clostridiaceae bacterium]
MDKIQAKIHYIYHSGFVIETQNYLLVFDYYKEPGKSIENSLFPSLLLAETIKEKKEIFVFCSHSHGDHFNPVILDWESYNSEIKYILSKDIKTSTKKSNYIFMEEDNEKEISNLYIKAYGSTDIGISFLVKADNLIIFHAGDLNWWHWKEDSLEEQHLAELNFKIQIAKLKKEETIDIAFFPVDPRLEEFYHVGGQYFGEQLHPNLLIPMHFADNLLVTKEFSAKMEKLNIKSIEIKYPSEEINYSKN